VPGQRKGEKLIDYVQGMDVSKGCLDVGTGFRATEKGTCRKQKYIQERLSVVGVTKSIGLAVGVAVVTKSVDLEETAEAIAVAMVGVLATVAGKAPESTILKRVAAGKTRRIARLFILSVTHEFLTVRG
jgi:hypothetical protein